MKRLLPIGITLLAIAIYWWTRPVETVVVPEEKMEEERPEVILETVIAPVPKRTYTMTAPTSIQPVTDTEEEIPIEWVVPLDTAIVEQEIGEKIPETWNIRSQYPAILDPSVSKVHRITLQFFNSSGEDFSGKLAFDVPKGIRSLPEMEVNISAGDTVFVPVVFAVGSVLSPDHSKIEFRLSDAWGRIVDQGSTILSTEEYVNLQLSLDQNTQIITQFSDSSTVAARVFNRGNTSQKVTVVFAFPKRLGGKSFREVQAWVEAGRDTVLQAAIWPKDLDPNQTNVMVSGLYGPDKQSFGHANLLLQLLSSSARFLDSSPDPFMIFDPQFLPQELSVSYRRFGRSDLVQVAGGGHVDLRAGSVLMQGLLYKNELEWTAMNTVLTYRLNRNSLSVGNINESMEYSLFGRGVKAVITAGENTTKLGVVDPQFNLLSTQGLFQQGVSFFAKNFTGNNQRLLGVNYQFRQDTWENAGHHIGGMEKKWSKGNWNFHAKTHAGFSTYTGDKTAIPSGSGEFQYSGTRNKIIYSGNYYYASNYFPGNRRGSVQLQQNVLRPLSDGRSLRGSALYARYSPRSKQYDVNVQNANFRGEAVYQWKSVGLGYQVQTESANSAYLGGEITPAANELKTVANRMVEYYSGRWRKHQVYATLENGLMRYYYQQKWKPQARLNFLYAYGEFNFSATYQYGSYYLSEQHFSRSLNKVTKRVLANASWTKNFRVASIQLGANFSRDAAIGNTYSANAGARFHVRPSVVLFFNSILYNYSYRDNLHVSVFNNTQINVEAGMTYRFKETTPSSGKKSKLMLEVFKDKNGNLRRDEGEELAPNYMLVLNGKVFMSDEKGRIDYSGLPFGMYKVGASAQDGWFNAEMNLVVDGYRKSFPVALRQAGSVRGKITMTKDERIAKDIEPSLGGISLKVLHNGQVVQHLYTDNDGNYMGFFPNGIYQIVLDEWIDEVRVLNGTQTFGITSGTITEVPAFDIEIRNKRINLKQFTQVTKL
jgi:hypothetical protein